MPDAITRAEELVGEISANALSEFCVALETEFVGKPNNRRTARPHSFGQTRDRPKREKCWFCKENLCNASLGGGEAVAHVCYERGYQALWTMSEHLVTIVLIEYPFRYNIGVESV